MTVAAVIVAAGKGERFGDSGKVLADLNGHPVLAHSLRAFEQASSVTEIIIVSGEHTYTAISHVVSSFRTNKVRRVVIGGATRQQSTANGVAAASREAEIILVHDAARPLIRPDQIEACITAAREHGGAILAAPVTDTVKRVNGGRITETVDRSMLWAAQTPQVFRAELMREMVAHSLRTEAPVTDEASMAEALGFYVGIVPGDSSNIKITHPSDIIVAEALLRARKDQAS